jgi:hypothetical protein
VRAPTGQSRSILLVVWTRRRPTDSREVIVRYLGETRHSLVHGQDYVVLTILAEPNRPVSFMVHLPGDRITDWAWDEAGTFEVIDGTLPSNWVYSVRGDALSLEPAAWTRKMHWDDLLNDASPADREQAWADHRTERDLILAEAGRPPGRRGSIVTCSTPPLK